MDIIDFSSSLYLGLRYSSEDLGYWYTLSKGKPPAAGGEPKMAKLLAPTLAKLIGCEDGVFTPSTLHSFIDIFDILRRLGIVIFIDSKVYPIARWGSERAIGKGIMAVEFKHFDPFSLEEKINKYCTKDVRPVVVTSSLCGTCCKIAPLKKYISIIRPYNGLLVIDDTQTFGILGQREKNSLVYGRGGGGILRWFNLKDESIIVINSMAKGFGVPVAIFAGSKKIIRYFKERSVTRVHCSPPSTVVINGAENALEINYIAGDYLRERLLRRVIFFKRLLFRIGLESTGGFFPIQNIITPVDVDNLEIYKKLLGYGVRPILRLIEGRKEPQITFLIRADHTSQDIYSSVNIIRKSLEEISSKSITNKSKEYF